MTTNTIQYIDSDTNMNQKIKLYKEVFGAEPWNEGYVCGNCEQTLPRDFVGKCSCGEVNDFQNFYPNEQTKSDFQSQMSRQKYRECIAQTLDGDYLGFTWGWNTSLSQLNTDKLGIDDMSQLQDTIQKIYPDFPIDDFYYFSEIGVKQEARGCDIAGELYRQKVNSLVNEGQKYMLLRTTRTSDMPYNWFRSLGFEEVYEYKDALDRVILITKL